VYHTAALELETRQSAICTLDCVFITHSRSVTLTPTPLQYCTVFRLALELAYDVDGVLHRYSAEDETVQLGKAFPTWTLAL
jgi:hypothetical protein